jgi:hypothetical protein
MPMSEDLLKQQEELQEEAHTVLDDLQLEALFGHYGNVLIGGSVTLGLMTWRDIDIGIEVENLPIREQILEIAYHILSFPGIKGVNVMDNTDLLNPHHPKGIYFGLRYLTGEKKLWKFDIWFITKDVDNGRSYQNWVRENLTPEYKLAILTIKNAIHDNPKYKKTVFSTDVYDAVIKHGVTDLEGFKMYLKESGRDL